MYNTLLPSSPKIMMGVSRFSFSKIMSICTKRVFERILTFLLHRVLKSVFFCSRRSIVGPDPTPAWILLLRSNKNAPHTLEHKSEFPFEIISKKSDPKQVWNKMSLSEVPAAAAKLVKKSFKKVGSYWNCFCSSAVFYHIQTQSKDLLTLHSFTILQCVTFFVMYSEDPKNYRPLMVWFSTFLSFFCI